VKTCEVSTGYTIVEVPSSSEGLLHSKLLRLT